MTPDITEVKLKKQDKLEKTYKFILGTIIVLVAIAIAAIFTQVYEINAKINSEVKQISAAQQKNHIINNQQNSVILGYLVCIGTIQPQDRTTAIINACVTQAQKQNTSLINQ